uniref:Alpha-macroglobulin receptor-binding domain-containing protein n=1 Tax=Crocodylus porosus TaxID=8502 RepID=A0A7M4F2P8_CROPO
MAIIDVKMLSGFVPIRSSLREVNDGKTKSDMFFLSCSQVSQKEIRFSFSIEQSLPISNIQPASVQIYDYYQTAFSLGLSHLSASIVR